MNISEYVPEAVDGRYYKMIVEIRHCHTCGKGMIRKPSGNGTGFIDPFPGWRVVNFDAQVERAGWVVESGHRVDGHEICAACVKAGKATFICSLCKERYQTDQEQYSIGDPPEYLCVNCYETVPAKIWMDKLKELYHAHQYDHL